MARRKLSRALVRKFFNGIAPSRVTTGSSGSTGISADTALRLAKALGTTAQLWLNLQNDYKLQIENRDLGNVLDHVETVRSPPVGSAA